MPNFFANDISDVILKMLFKFSCRYGLIFKIMESFGEVRRIIKK